ncbi:pilin [Agarivorans aestuarii]|uniref:pilin n=1 Tax=Agarivorans aestuarii TaxID=1563703 RepID=UPI001C7E936A|nr:prepilin-type N-terminal cleavage/methylation domain-containing protein [Agarivorans aestuarii]
MKTIQNLQAKAANKQAGFTLIELMIVVAIVAILAAVALPAYQTYTRKAAFSEVIAATGPYKTAFEIAVQTGRVTALADADAGSNGIPSAATATGSVTSVDMTNGVITATGSSDVGSYTYILTPNGVTAPVQWSDDATGNVSTCIAAGVC